MRKNRLLAASLIAALSCSAAVASSPYIAKRYVENLAKNRGWDVTLSEAHLGYMCLDLSGVVASSSDKSKSVRLDKLRVYFDTSLDPNDVFIQGGAVKATVDTSEKPTKAGRKLLIHAKNIDVDVNVQDVKISAKNTSIELTDVLSIRSDYVKAESRQGTITADGVSFSKTGDGTTAYASNLSADAYGHAVKFTDVVVENPTFSKENVSFHAQAKQANFPKGVVALGLSADVSKTDNKVSFKVFSESTSGQNKRISTGQVETKGLSISGSVELFDTSRWMAEVVVTSKNASVKAFASRAGAAWAFSGNLEKTPCQAVLEAIPEDMREELDGMKFSGDMSAGFSVSLSEEKNSVPDVTVNLDHRCRVEQLPKRISDAMGGKPFTRTVYTKDGQTKDVLSGGGLGGWVPLSAVSPYVMKAVMTTEDPGFYGHHGFILEAIKNSLRDNIRDRKFTRGASTIPMQLAKNMFLGRDKTATRKLQEFFLTIALDQKMSKDRIAETYLNIVEFGPDVYGISAASMHYFGIQPYDLTLGQSVFIASILPKPKASHFDAEGNLNRWKKVHIDNILDLMLSKGVISEEEYETAKQENLSTNKPKQKVDTAGWDVQ